MKKLPSDGKSYAFSSVRFASIRAAIIPSVALKECEPFFNNALFVPSKFRSRSKFVCCQIVWWRSLYHQKLGISWEVCIHAWLTVSHLRWDNRPGKDSERIYAFRYICICTTEGWSRNMRQIFYAKETLCYFSSSFLRKGLLPLSFCFRYLLRTLVSIAGRPVPVSELETTRAMRTRAWILISDWIWFTPLMLSKSCSSFLNDYFPTILYKGINLNV